MRPSCQASKARSRARPAVAARAVVAARQRRDGGEHLVVEVAPAELAHEGPAAASRSRASLSQLQRRDAAEAQVGAEPGGAVAGQVVVARRRSRRGRRGGRPASACGPRVSPPAARSRRGLAAGQLLQRRQPAGGEPTGHRAACAAPPPARRERQLAPGAVVGGEDLEVVAAGRGHRARAGRSSSRGGRGSRSAPPRRPRASRCSRSLRVGAPVGADVELARRRTRAPPRAPPRPGRRGAGRAARRALRSASSRSTQRLAHEGDPVRGREARAEQRLVEDEERHRPLGPRRGREGRVVVDPQVAVEEDERGLHFALW